MTFKELARGVAIFDRYMEPGDTVVADHDELMLCHVSTHEMAQHDAETLRSLGWHWNDQERHWRHFT